MSSATAAPVPGGAALEETNMVDQIKVLGVAGSLRQGSYNKAALRAAI